MHVTHSIRTSGAVVLICLMVASVAYGQNAGLGYDDTPLLPSGDWRIHDGTRPQPPIVTPGPGAGFAAAPGDATVLLGPGSDLSSWQMTDGSPATWAISDGILESGRGLIETRTHFGDFQLHVEFATPTEVRGDGQERGNSGVFLLGQFEIQVLDSFNNPTYPDGQAAAMYGQYPPRVNASRPPGEWQAYDITFTAPRFDFDGRLAKGAVVTVIHNGLVVHHATEFWGPTEHRMIGPYRPEHTTGPIALQDHGNPVRYRNIWIRTLNAYDQ